MKDVKYLVTYEQGPTSWGATVPAWMSSRWGKTFEDAQENVKEAIECQIEGLLKLGLPVPPQQLSRQST
jgi:predicted RNase H-like HicB family nuclease